MIKILADCRTDPAAAERLAQTAGIDLVFSPDPVDNRPRLLEPALIADVDILLCTFPPQNLDTMKRLRFLQITSTGYSQLFGLGLVKRGIRASNSRGVFDTPIGEWNIAMMINLRRDLRGMIRHQEARHWAQAARFQGDIRGATVGFWGYGGIARETARLGQAFGLTIHTLTRSGVKPRIDTYRVPGTGDPTGGLPDRVFTLDQKEEFLGGLDFLVMALPLTKNSAGIVGAAELQMLPSTAFILNPARGPLIQEAPLLQALREGWIAGAALDTHYYYPMPANHPLWELPNVIMTPHISGSSGGSYFLPRIWDLFSQNVNRWQEGRPLLNELTPEQLSGE